MNQILSREIYLKRQKILKFTHFFFAAEEEILKKIHVSVRFDSANCLFGQTEFAKTTR